MNKSTKATFTRIRRFLYPQIFFMRIHLASTRVRRIRSVYPEISVYALQSGNFCIRCVSGYVWTLVSVYFCIRWRHSIRTSLKIIAGSAFFVMRMLCWLILWDVRIRIGYVYATWGRRYFCIRIKKFADTKIPGYVWTGPQKNFILNWIKQIGEALQHFPILLQS